MPFELAQETAYSAALVEKVLASFNDFGFFQMDNE